MKLFFYRKLEIASRIYILNYGDVTKLDQAFSFKDFTLNKKAKLLNRLNNETNLDTSNTKLIVASLSKNMLHKLFRTVYISLLLQDSSIRSNGKVLAILSKDLSKLEMDSIIENNVHNTNSVLSLTQYDLKEVINNLQLCYFESADASLYQNLCKRFNFNEINPEISAIVKPLLLDKHILFALDKVLPNTNLVINHYKSKRAS